MFTGELYSDEELGLEAEISRVRYLISICDLGIKETDKQMKELFKAYDDNKIMLQMLDKKADDLTRNYINLNDQLRKLLKQVD